MKRKLIRLVFVSISITAQKFSKVNLSMSHGVCKRQTACESLAQYETLFADVSFHAAVSARVTGFRTKPVISSWRYAAVFLGLWHHLRAIR